MNYPAAILAARRRASLSQATLARRSGRTQSALSMMESGRRRPSLDAIEAIARGLGVSPLVLHLLAANGRDVPKGTDGVRMIGAITRLVDDLWRWRRHNGNGSRNHRR